jgi:hypothetical protein
MNQLVERLAGPMLAVHQWLYEHGDGRIGARLGGRPMLLLRTVARRSGRIAGKEVGSFKSRSRRGIDSGHRLWARDPDKGAEPRHRRQTWRQQKG